MDDAGHSISEASDNTEDEADDAGESIVEVESDNLTVVEAHDAGEQIVEAVEPAVVAKGQPSEFVEKERVVVRVAVTLALA